MKKIIVTILVMVMLIMLLPGCVSRQGYDALMVEYDGLRARVESVQNELVATRSQVQTLQGDLVTEQSKSAKLESDLTAAQSRSTKLESDLTTEQRNTEKLERDLSAAQSRYSSLKSESGRVKSDLAEAQAQIADLEEVAPELFYKDDFSFSGSGWAQASKEDVEYDYEGGEYYIENKKYDWVFWTVNRNAGWFDDFALEIDARLVSGPKETHYGLLFRHQDNDNFYFFRVSGDGYYSVDKQLDDRWKTIQRKRQSDFIEEGNSTNHLKVVCKGSQIVVYVNGYHLATFTDDSFHGGYVAIAVATNKPNGRVAFDNIRVYSLD